MITRRYLGWSDTKAPTSNTDLGMVVHYDGSNQGLAQKTCGVCKAYWRKTRVVHMQGNGWLDIGYAYGVCPHGEIYEGRGYGRVQAAARHTPGKLSGGNERWVNVTFMSGPDEAPTDEQIVAFQALRSLLQSKGMGDDVKCHGDFTATSCPGNKLRNMVEQGTLVKGAMVKAADVWKYEIPVPWGTPENPDWQARSLLLEVNKRIREVQSQLDSLVEQLAEIRGRIGNGS